MVGTLCARLGWLRRRNQAGRRRRGKGGMQGDVEMGDVEMGDVEIGSLWAASRDSGDLGEAAPTGSSAAHEVLMASCRAAVARGQ